jgi:hypothetical protein
VSFSKNDHRFLKSDAPNRMVITAKIIKMKNRIFAMDAAPAAIPPNPKMAAMMAITKKIAA